MAQLAQVPQVQLGTVTAASQETPGTVIDQAVQRTAMNRLNRSPVQGLNTLPVLRLQNILKVRG